ncbi:hypothetical protein ABT160_31065 [Streptomyces sp. NPDC001941]|uniref:WXG100-like domain-containing protein n=1 Tax=Streptomyces sp. NPDC001941 TaxID=3154659 RepID=UPI00332E651E
MSLEFPPQCAWLFAALTGEKPPSGDEDKLFALAEVHKDLHGKLTNDLKQQVAEALGYTRESFRGDAAEMYQAAMKSFIGEEGLNYFDAVADQARLLAEFSRKGATQLQYTKYMIIAQLVELLVEAVIAAATAFFFGASLQAYFAKVAFVRWLIKFRLGRLVLMLISHQIINVGMGVAMDLLVQWAQLNQGTRDEFEGDLTKNAALSGMIQGFLAGPFQFLGNKFGKGLAHLFGKDSGKNIGKQLDDAFKHKKTELPGPNAPKSFGDDLAKNFGDHVPRTAGPRELSDKAAKDFVKSVGDTFDKHVKREGAREVGENWARTLLRDTGKKDLTRNLDDALGPVRKTLGRDATHVLTQGTADALAQSMLRHWAQTGAHGAGKGLFEGAHAAVSEGMYNLIFSDEHTLKTSALTFGSGIVEGRLGHVLEMGGEHLGDAARHKLLTGGMDTSGGLSGQGNQGSPNGAGDGTANTASPAAESPAPEHDDGTATVPAPTPVPAPVPTTSSPAAGAAATTGPAQTQGQGQGQSSAAQQAQTAQTANQGQQGQTHSQPQSGQNAGQEKQERQDKQGKQEKSPEKTGDQTGRRPEAPHRPSTISTGSTGSTETSGSTASTASTASVGSTGTTSGAPLQTASSAPLTGAHEAPVVTESAPAPGVEHTSASKDAFITPASATTAPAGATAAPTPPAPGAPASAAHVFSLLTPGEVPAPPPAPPVRTLDEDRRRFGVPAGHGRLPDRDPEVRAPGSLVDRPVGRAELHRFQGTATAAVHTERFDPTTARDRAEEAAGRLPGSETLIRHHVRRERTDDGRTVRHLLVTLPFKLADHLDASDLAALEERVQGTLDTHLNRGYRLPRSGDQLMVSVKFLSAPEHGEAISLDQTLLPARADQTSWDLSHDDATLTHEVLHYLGLKDEYEDTSGRAQGDPHLFRRDARLTGVRTTGLMAVLSADGLRELPNDYLALIEDVGDTVRIPLHTGLQAAGAPRTSSLAPDAPVARPTSKADEPGPSSAAKGKRVVHGPSRDEGQLDELREQFPEEHEAQARIDEAARNDQAPAAVPAAETGPPFGGGRFVRQDHYASGDQFAVAATLVGDADLSVRIEYAPDAAGVNKKKAEGLAAFYAESQIPRNRIEVAPKEARKTPGVPAAESAGGAKARGKKPAPPQGPKPLEVGEATERIARTFTSGLRDSLRTAWGVSRNTENDAVYDSAVGTWLEERLGLRLRTADGGARPRVAVVWSRFSGKNGEVHLEHDTSHSGVAQLIGELGDLDAVLIVGDADPRSVEQDRGSKYDEIASHYNRLRQATLQREQDPASVPDAAGTTDEDGTYAPDFHAAVVNLTEFWVTHASAVGSWSESGRGLRTSQFRLYEHLDRHFTTRHVGFRSGNLEAMALLGYQVRYLEEPNSIMGGSRMAKWHAVHAPSDADSPQAAPLTALGGMATGYERILVNEPPTRTGRHQLSLGYEAIAGAQKHGDWHRDDKAAKALDGGISRRKGFHDEDVLSISAWLRTGDPAHGLADPVLPDGRTLRAALRGIDSTPRPPAEGKSRREKTIDKLRENLVQLEKNLQAALAAEAEPAEGKKQNPKSFGIRKNIDKTNQQIIEEQAKLAEEQTEAALVVEEWQRALAEFQTLAQTVDPTDLARARNLYAQTLAHEFVVPPRATTSASTGHTTTQSPPRPGSNSTSPQDASSPVPATTSSDHHLLAPGDTPRERRSSQAPEDPGESSRAGAERNSRNGKERARERDSAEDETERLRQLFPEEATAAHAHEAAEEASGMGESRKRRLGSDSGSEEDRKMPRMGTPEAWEEADGYDADTEPDPLQRALNAALRRDFRFYGAGKGQSGVTPDVRLRFARSKADERPAQTLTHVSSLLHEVMRLVRPTRVQTRTGERATLKNSETQGMLVNGRLVFATNIDQAVTALRNRVAELGRGGEPPTLGVVLDLLRTPTPTPPGHAGTSAAGQPEPSQGAASTSESRLAPAVLEGLRNEEKKRLVRADAKVRRISTHPPRAEDASAAALRTALNRPIDFTHLDDPRLSTLLTDPGMEGAVILVTQDPDAVDSGSRPTSFHAEQKLLAALHRGIDDPAALHGPLVVHGRFRPCAGCAAALTYTRDRSGFSRLAFNDNHGYFWKTAVKNTRDHLPDIGRDAHYWRLLDDRLQRTDDGRMSTSAVSEMRPPDGHRTGRPGGEEILLPPQRVVSTSVVTASDTDVEPDGRSVARRRAPYIEPTLNVLGEGSSTASGGRPALHVLYPEERRQLSDAYREFRASLGTPGRADARQRLRDLVIRFHGQGGELHLSSTFEEIGKAMGVSGSTPFKLFHNRTGHEARDRLQFLARVREVVPASEHPASLTDFHWWFLLTMMEESGLRVRDVTAVTGLGGPWFERARERYAASGGEIALFRPTVQERLGRHLPGGFGEFRLGARDWLTLSASDVRELAARDRETVWSVLDEVRRMTADDPETFARITDLTDSTERRRMAAATQLATGLGLSREELAALTEDERGLLDAAVRTVVGLRSHEVHRTMAALLPDTAAPDSFHDHFRQPGGEAGTERRGREILARIESVTESALEGDSTELSELLGMGARWWSSLTPESQQLLVRVLRTIAGTGDATTLSELRPLLARVRALTDDRPLATLWANGRVLRLIEALDLEEAHRDDGFQAPRKR